MSTNAQIFSGDEPPGLPTNNTLWYDTNSGDLFIYNQAVPGWIQLTGGTVSLLDKSVTIEKLSDDIIDANGGLQKGSEGLKIAKESESVIILHYNNLTGIDYNKDNTHETKTKSEYLYSAYHINDKFINFQDIYKWINDNANSPRSEIHIILESEVSDTYELFYIKTGLSTFGYSKKSSMVPNNGLGNIHHWSLAYWNYLTGQADHIDDLTLFTLYPDSKNRLDRAPFSFEDNCTFHGIHFLFDLGSSAVEHNSLFLANGCSMKFSYCKVGLLGNSDSYDDSKLNNVFSATNGGLIKVTSDIYGQPLMGKEVVSTVLDTVTSEIQYCDSKIWDGSCEGVDQLFFITRELLDPFHKGMPSHALELNCRQVYINNIFHAKNKSTIEIKEYRNNIGSMLGTECSAFHISNDASGLSGKVRFSYMTKLEDFSRFDTNTKFSKNNLLQVDSISSFNSKSYSAINVSNALTTVPNWNIDDEGNAVFGSFEQAYKAPKLYSQNVFNKSNKAPFFVGTFPIEAPYRGTEITLVSDTEGLLPDINIIGDGQLTINELIDGLGVSLASGDGNQILQTGETITISGGTSSTVSKFEGTFRVTDTSPSIFNGNFLVSSGAAPNFSGSFFVSSGYAPRFIGYYAGHDESLPTKFTGTFTLVDDNQSTEVEIVAISADSSNDENFDINNWPEQSLINDLIITGDGVSTINDLLSNAVYADSISQELQQSINTLNLDYVDSTKGSVEFTSLSDPDNANLSDSLNESLHQNYILYIKSGDGAQILKDQEQIRLSGSIVPSGQIYLLADDSYSQNVDISPYNSSFQLMTWAEIISLTGLGTDGYSPDLKINIASQSDQNLKPTILQKISLGRGYNDGTPVDIVASAPYDQSIFISGDGLKTINELISETIFCSNYNGVHIDQNCNQYGSLNLTSGDGTQIPRDGEIIELTGGSTSSTDVEITSTYAPINFSQLNGDGVKTLDELISDFNDLENQKEINSIDNTTGQPSYNANNLSITSGDGSQVLIYSENINFPIPTITSSEVEVAFDTPGVAVVEIIGDGSSTLEHLSLLAGSTVTIGDGSQVPALGEIITIQGGENGTFSQFTGDFISPEPENVLVFEYGTEVSLMSNIYSNHLTTITGDGASTLLELADQSLVTVVSGDSSQVMKSGQSISLSGGTNTDSDYSYNGPTLTSSTENTQTSDSDYF